MSNARIWKRREFLKAVGIGTAAAAAAAKTRTASGAPVSPAKNVLTIDPTPLFELSPHLYMQFMEPLGVTDSSVDAAWDFLGDGWR